MIEQSVTSSEFIAYDFAAGLLAGLARQGVTSMLAPQMDRENLSDRAAAHTYAYLDRHFANIFHCRFAIYTHPIHGYSTDWRQALYECGHNGLVSVVGDSLHFDRALLEHVSRRLPGTMVIWDALAIVFLQEYRATTH